MDLSNSFIKRYLAVLIEKLKKSHTHKKRFNNLPKFKEYLISKKKLI